ncbi:hypothetical protein FA13DRAFT_574465 [Coprinellus micaceus]|uniref:Uncharacterized protein n=1 Tax=Coprinellus micaceus TaxID=71717 RepID=A0A4Y7T7P9_COPMI|nr:hypothetical protein FA13DRAFT_574465 [Coprinellus micaceus]
MVVVEKEREDELRRQEDEEFERALAQSMLETSNYGGGQDLTLNTNIEDDQVATSSKVRLDSPVWENGSRPSSRVDSAGSSSSPAPVFEFGRYDKSRIPGLERGQSATDTSNSVAAGKQRASPTDEDAAPPYPSGTDMTTSEKQPEQQSELSPIELADVQPILAQEEPEKIFRDGDATPSNLRYNSVDTSSKSPPPIHILRGSVDSLGWQHSPPGLYQPSRS